MLNWDDDLRLDESDLFLDSRTPRALCFISHAHSDHLAPHAHSICTPATAALARHREAEMGRITELHDDQPLTLDPRTELCLLPAGHVLGSAMLHVRRDERTLLYTGDFK